MILLSSEGVTMDRMTAFVCGFLAFSLLSAASVPPRHPPLPPAKPITDSIFGKAITDRYRYFEEQNANVTNWMKAEGRYTRSVLDALPRHDQILNRLTAMTSSWDIVRSIVRSSGGRLFYEERSAGSDNFDLMVRAPDGQVHKIVDMAAVRAAGGGEPFAISYFQPSNDGKKVAVGISEGGSEDASLWVYDSATGLRIAGPLANARFGPPSWEPDDRHLFVNVLSSLRPTQGQIDRFNFSKVYSWDFESVPIPILGADLSRTMPFNRDEIPEIATFPEATVVLAEKYNGSQNEVELWTAPTAEVSHIDAPWQRLVTREDDVTSVTIAGNRIFMLSHQGAPTFKVLALNVGEPFAAAKTTIASRPDRLLESIAAAADGLYVTARHGVYSELIKVPFAGGPEQVIALPFKGSINELSADPRYPGASIILNSWAVPPRTFTYTPGKGFADLGVGSGPAGFDTSMFEALDLRARSIGRVEVPLSLVTAKTAKRPRPLLLAAYGSYGISQFPAFGTRAMATLPNGIDYAVCHVRGGGELGDLWRLGGKDANKPNTWRDLIACAEHLIAAGYTRSDMLFIIGESAGGIAVGRAMEERPDLFGGVFDLVPVANTVRTEFSPNGRLNIPEFGTVRNQQGFKNLLAMDSVLNVKRGVRYPPIVISTGLNDTRVASWEAAKLVATLLTANDPNPVLLRIDEKAGHGVGSTKSQSDVLYADLVSFIISRTAEVRTGGRSQRSSMRH